MIRDVLSEAARFHGHLGPWLALGLRAGLYARRKLAGSPFELTAKVFCPVRPPYSCFVDGVQFGSGCTMGKANICHIRARGCRVEFARHSSRGPATGRSKTGPAKLVLELRPEVWAELRSNKASGWAAAARLGKTLYGRAFDSLFNVGPA